MDEPCEVCGLDHGQDHTPCFEVKDLRSRIAELEAENKRMVDLAGDALGFSEYQRDSDTVEVLAHHAKRLAEELDKVKAAKERTVDQVEALTLSLEFANKELAAVKGELAECKADLKTYQKSNQDFARQVLYAECERDGLRARCERLEGALKRIADWPEGAQSSIAKQALEVPK